MRRNITTQGGVGGGCNSKHYWLELLLDRSNNFNWFFDWVFVCQNFSAGPRLHFFVMRKRLVFLENPPNTFDWETIIPSCRHILFIFIQSDALTVFVFFGYCALLYFRESYWWWWWWNMKKYRTAERLVTSLQVRQRHWQFASQLFPPLHEQQPRPLFRAQAPLHGQETTTDPWSY